MSKNKVVNVIRHLAFEDLGSFASALQAKDIEINYIEAGYDDLAQLDALSDELLVILGGPISVNDEEIFPFLKTEIDFLRQRIAADKPTLGICLGAQLIAKALNVAVYSGAVKEIGWQGLKLTAAGEQSALRYLSSKHCSMLHWHGETFDLPSSAVLLASTEGCTNQAFSYGDNVLALQFHPEVTQYGMEKWFIGHIGEILQTQGVTVTQLRQETRQFSNRLEVQGELFFNSWFNEVI